jgi:hypothetical protein
MHPANQDLDAGTRARTPARQPFHHPTDEDLSVGTPGREAGATGSCDPGSENRDLRPTDNDLSVGTPEHPVGVETPDLPSAAVFVGFDGGAGFAVGFAAALSFALVPVLLALGESQFALDAAVAKVKAGGDERMSLDLRLLE